MSAVTSAVTSASDNPYQDLPFYKVPYSISPEFAQYRTEVRESLLALMTPLNFAIIVILLTLIYYRFSASGSQEPDLPSQKATIFRTFTPRTLLPFSGKPSKPWNPEGKVYLAVKGKVYDVTLGKNFYGPGGPYENFAGRDATRGLACQSFDEDMLTKNLDGPLDDCKDLGADEMENLQSWVERFEEKYLVVGKLVAFNTGRNPWRD